MVEKLFAAHKEHFDYRFDELHEDLKECHRCHDKVEQTLAGKISALEDSQKEFEKSDKQKAKKQLIVSGIFGFLGGSCITLISNHYGGVLSVLAMLF